MSAAPGETRGGDSEIQRPARPMTAIAMPAARKISIRNRSRISSSKRHGEDVKAYVVAERLLDVERHAVDPFQVNVPARGLALRGKNRQHCGADRTIKRHGMRSLNARISSGRLTSTISSGRRTTRRRSRSRLEPIAISPLMKIATNATSHTTGKSRLPRRLWYRTRRRSRAS